MQRGCQKMSKRRNQVLASHQSAPVGLEWLPSGFKGILTRSDLGEDDDRPATFFPNGLLKANVLVSKECADGCRINRGCQRMSKRRNCVIAGHQSAPVGLELLPSGFKGILTRSDLGKDDNDRPATFFPNGLLKANVLVSKECAEGWRMQMIKNG